MNRKLKFINLNRNMSKDKIALHKIFKNINLKIMIKLNSFNIINTRPCITTTSVLLPSALHLYFNIRYFSASITRYIPSVKEYVSENRGNWCFKF